jgi:hypothetical protein
MQTEELLATDIASPSTTDTFFLYESTLETYRLEFGDRLSTIFLENPRTLMLFWIHFCSQGVGMTEPVEDWIRRAGNKCKDLGYTALGTALCKHAIHEAKHELMMIRDTKNLISQWNKLYTPLLEAEAVLKSPYNEAVIQYQDLHESYIASEHPYCQIAIEYEIENLSATYGAKVLQHTFKILGEDFREFLSFVDDHVRIDVAHTEFNRKVISEFISAYPHAVRDLIAAGKKALEIYGDFLNDCAERASVA